MTPKTFRRQKSCSPQKSFWRQAICWRPKKYWRQKIVDVKKVVDQNLDWSKVFFLERQLHLSLLHPPAKLTWKQKLIHARAHARRLWIRSFQPMKTANWNSACARARTPPGSKSVLVRFRCCCRICCDCCCYCCCWCCCHCWNKKQQQQQQLLKLKTKGAAEAAALAAQAAASASGKKTLRPWRAAVVKMFPNYFCTWGSRKRTWREDWKSNVN